jgi:hypothetical protein
MRRCPFFPAFHCYTYDHLAVSRVAAGNADAHMMQNLSVVFDATLRPGTVYTLTTQVSGCDWLVASGLFAHGCSVDRRCIA